MGQSARMGKFMLGAAATLLVAGCESLIYGKIVPLPEPTEFTYDYRVAPGDSLSIFVWRNPDLSTTASVRPDGKITVPLVEDIPATGKTSTELAREIEEALSKYVRDPLVTVIVGGFVGVTEQKIRILGEATNPAAIPYREGMTLLDLMLVTGGFTQFAAANRAQLIRMIDGEPQQMRVRLEDLIKDADLTADVKLAPGDILIIPEAWF